MEPHLNFLALIASSLVPLIMGMIYYHPSLMGTKWMMANDFIKEKMTPPKPVMYLLALICSFLLSVFLWGWVIGAGGMDQMQVKDPVDGHSYVTFQHGVVHGVIFSITVLLPIFVTMR